MAMNRTEKRDLFKGLAFTSPWIIGFSLFIFYPIVASLYYSFTDFNVLRPPMFIGLKNYTTLLSDGLFWTTVLNTAIYAAFALPLSLAVSLGVAMLLARPMRMQGIFRTVFFLPSLTPLVALAIVWQWIFNGQFGVLNYVLGNVLAPLGLSPPNWLVDPSWTKPALILTALWGVGGSIVIYCAALQDVPAHLYEAAEIDGASAFHKMIHVTLPMISPAIYFNLVMGIIGTLQIFAVPYVMFSQSGSSRGPGNSTYFLAMYVYDNAFKYLKMGYASALSWIMFLLILGLTLLATRATRKHIYYGAE